MKESLMLSREKGTLHSENRPPKLFEYLLFFLSKKQRKPLQNEFQAGYYEISDRFGLRYAKFWYAVKVMAFLAPSIFGALQKVGKAAIGIGGMAVLRRFIS